MTWWWLSTERMTVAVAESDGILLIAPPIVRRFIAQPSKNLGRWLRKQPGFRAERL